MTIQELFITKILDSYNEFKKDSIIKDDKEHERRREDVYNNIRINQKGIIKVLMA
jgi:hypothetical protein